MGSVIDDTPKRHILPRNTSFDVDCRYRSLRSVHPFVQLTYTLSPIGLPTILCFTMLFSRQQTPKSALPMGVFAPQHGFLDAPDSAFKLHLDGFTRFTALTAERLHFTNYSGPPPVPLKIAHSHGGSGPRLIHGSLTHPVNIPNGIMICSAAFAGLTVVISTKTDRPTDHATPSVQ